MTHDVACFAITVSTISVIYFCCVALYANRKRVKFGKKYKDRNLVTISNPWYREWIAVRACHCGHHGVSNTKYKNIVICDRCGALHSTTDAAEPIAALKCDR